MTQQKLQIATVVAEIVSATAIVVSLLFVAYELRQSSTVTSRDVELILFERAREANRIVIENESLARLIIDIESGAPTSSATDSLRYLLHRLDFYNSWEVAWSYHADEILTTDAWKEWNAWYASEAARLPRFAWQDNRHHFTGESFRQHVDRVIGVD